MSKRVKEDRSDWVAVESDVKDTGKKLEKYKTAFQYFQKRMTPSISQELKDAATEDSPYDIGALGKELSKRWNLLDEEEKREYIELSNADKQRYEEECRKRDEEVEAERERKRAERNAEVDGKRERKRKFETPTPKPRVQRELTEEQKEAKRLRDEIRMQEKSERDELRNQQQKQLDELEKKKSQNATERLKYLLSQSDIFSHFGHSISKPKDNKKRMSEHEEDESMMHDQHDTVRLTTQPQCIKFGTMRGYQLEGLNWMINLSNRGVNGILADEMGLGKTLQTISVLAYHHEFRNVSGPHIVIVPKSTLSNWLAEFKRWCPVLRTVKLHGDKQTRDTILQEILIPGANSEDRKFDVCITTFEMCIKCKGHLGKFAWRYLVIDEAHRIKNEASQFSQVVRTLATEFRLLLTGTPLQNNLHELWALLNFLLPDIFASAEQFDEWFNLEIDDDEAKKKMITQLHRVLRPFMLRRLKADVEKSLPPKKETLLFVGMSTMQKQLYKSLLLRDMDAVTGTSTSRTALLNIVMQLRKCCGHPYLFEGQEDRTLDPMGEHLVENCGKLVLLDKLLKRLKQRGSRVLVFSQMTRVLDILEDFFRMRGYAYCRIDGNTSYEDREDSIDIFNQENSPKFAFLLSTRAGGLGINLYTADTVILYDSDWNPQADLQAQDRAHRIGQKKQVNVYRLVTNDTVEEKIIERAQQKLKLDAMVVQQGRLSDKKKTLSKSEMLSMIRFGADQVFRATKSTSITDEDIDAILLQGEARTEEMNKKIQAHDKGDMLDFRLDGTTNTQEYDGVDYSTQKKRNDELKRLAEAEMALHISESMGKRERRQVSNYYRQAGQAERKKRGKLLPKALRLPKMDEWQFYQKGRLVEIHEIECAAYEKAKAEEKPVTEYLDPETQEEKQVLLEEGFSDWNKQHFNLFTKLLARHGRKNLTVIARDLGKTLEDTEQYSMVFWERGEELSDWDKIVKNIEKGESKLLEIQRLTEQTAIKIARYSNPWEQLTLNYQGKQGKVYSEEEDRYLLCLTHRHGYGAWEKVKRDICRSERFLFDYYLKSRSAVELGRRCDSLMRLCEKDNADTELRESKERELKKKLQSDRKRIDTLLADARHELQVHQAKIDDLILQEAKNMQQERERKYMKIQQKRQMKKALEEQSVDRFLGPLLRFIQSNRKTDPAKIAIEFCQENSEVSAKSVMRKIQDVATLNSNPAVGESVWIINKEFVDRLNDPVRSPKKRKANDKTSNKNKDKSNSFRLSKRPRNGTPKKPRSAYVLFSLSKRTEVKSTLPNSATIVDLMRELTDLWKKLTPDEREPWIEASQLDQRRYQLEVEQCQQSTIDRKIGD